MVRASSLYLEGPWFESKRVDMKIFAEIGIGNETVLSTEFEEGDTEYRVGRFVIPPKIKSIYFRLWIGRRVYILSTNHGFEITYKDRKKFKLLFGVSGTP